MNVFGSSASEARLTASRLAEQQAKAYERVLGLRISLQRALDIGNQLPVFATVDSTDSKTAEDLDSNSSISNEYKKLRKVLQATLGDLGNLLESQSRLGGERKRKRVVSEHTDHQTQWENLLELQDSLCGSDGKWWRVLELWHARLNYGSEQAKGGMKVLKQSIKDQVEGAISEKRRMLDKTRMPVSESPRIGLSKDSGDQMAQSGVALDLEVYDDRTFYSLLLKAYITSTSGDNSQSSMQGADLQALQKLKKKKIEVDRRASKGRKIRYVVHPKLQNFMFPVASAYEAVAAGGLGVTTAEAQDKLFQSLFQ